MRQPLCILLTLSTNTLLVTGSVEEQTGCIAVISIHNIIQFKNVQYIFMIEKSVRIHYCMIGW